MGPQQLILCIKQTICYQYQSTSPNFLYSDIHLLNITNNPQEYMV